MDVLLEVKLETLLSCVNNLSFVASISTGSLSHYPGVFPGFIASRAGHPIIGRAIGAFVYAVATEMRKPEYQREEFAAYLSRYFPTFSLKFWQLRLPQCPTTLAVHYSLTHTSPDQPLTLGVVHLSEHDNALFLLVSNT